MNALRRALRMLLGKRPPSLQVGAICVDQDDGKVLLITSRGTGRWVIPKGWPMAGRTLSGAAAQEAWEEAGVEGDIQHDEIGRYSYGKDQDEGYSVPVEVHVFLLQVRKCTNSFPEADQRKRRWFTPAGAADMVAEPGLKKILRSLPSGHD